MKLETALDKCRLIAILRGVRPEESVDIAGVLIDAGITMIEVPLNSPEPYKSIERIATAYGDAAVIGAGTVLRCDACDRLKSAGGKLVVSPNCDPDVIRHAKRLNLYSFPGVATPSEAFQALGAGADGLKLFPFETIGVAGMKAWRAVLPKGTQLIPVGGVSAEAMAAITAAGATGFGIGSALYKAGQSCEQVSANAAAFVAAERERSVH